MSIHILGTGEKVALYSRIKFLEIAIEVANDENESEIIVSNLKNELQSCKDRYEDAEGSVLMDASGRFEFKMRAKMYIELMRNSEVD